MTFSGADLLVNADVAERELQVELLDANGRPIAGFRGTESRLVRHDRLRYRAIWGSDSAPKRLEDAHAMQPLSLRFILRKGRLYAFRAR
jgi:hypothetical protein